MLLFKMKLIYTRLLWFICGGYVWSMGTWSILSACLVGCLLQVYAAKPYNFWLLCLQGRSIPGSSIPGQHNPPKWDCPCLPGWSPAWHEWWSSQCWDHWCSSCSSGDHQVLSGEHNCPSKKKSIVAVAFFRCEATWLPRLTPWGWTTWKEKRRKRWSFGPSLLTKRYIHDVSLCSLLTMSKCW